MFIQTEETPNPASLKFIPGRTVLAQGTADFGSLEDASRSELARRLFEVVGIIRVFFGSDFITITKSNDYDWMSLKPRLLGIVMDYFMAFDSVTVEDMSSPRDLADLEALQASQSEMQA